MTTMTQTDLAEKIRDICPEISDIGLHIGRSMRASYLNFIAINQKDQASIASDVLDEIKNSVMITSSASKIHHLKDKIYEIRGLLAPWMKVIAGLTAGVAGLFLAGEIGVVAAAVLTIVGFVYAGLTALKTVLQAGDR